MRYIYFILIASLLKSGSLAQTQQTSPKCKLVVGIVVDQMRNDFIYRYWERYGSGGFKRLVNDGFYFRNNHFNYIPTYTGPGHSSIYTGTTPKTHGIIANEWFVKENGTITYCTQDSSVRSVGSKNKAGKMSPVKLLSSTIGDEMKISSNGKAKVFAVALKDRSAILPAGHAANGAFWYDDETGNFISSSWYMNELPAWLNQFNDKKSSRTYLEGGWSTLTYPEAYVNSLNDDNRYESVPNKKNKPVFPYTYKDHIDRSSWGIIKSTPYGNSITKDIAIACIRNEELGKDAVTDLFCISFSATDIIAHSYGPRSIEIEDTYLRLDKDIEELLNVLDKEVGKNNYTVFLTADHGGADVSNHLIDNKIPAGYINETKLSAEIKKYLQATYGDSLIMDNMSNEQVFLNEKKLALLKLEKDKVEEKLCEFLVSLNGIAEAYPSRVLKYESFQTNDLRSLIQNGYNHKLSGNIAIAYLPAWMDYTEKGTTHGAGYNYDTHVPLIFYGNGIKKGQTLSYSSITQIAPTVCELIKINQPNSCNSEPLNENFK